MRVEVFDNGDGYITRIEVIADPGETLTEGDLVIAGRKLERRCRDNGTRLYQTDLARVAELYREAKESGAPTSWHIVAHLPILSGKDRQAQARQLVHRARKLGYLNQ